MVLTSSAKFLRIIVRHLTIYIYKNKIDIAKKLERKKNVKEDSILYEVKQLEKVIFRNIVCTQSLDNKQNIIPPTQMQIMAYMLNNVDKDIYQKDLERVLHLRRATVSGVLKTMEKNNLIDRIKNEDDIRGKKIILNDKAKNIFKEGKKKIKELEKIAVKDISKEDMNIFLNVISKMKSNIEESEEINV